MRSPRTTRRPRSSAASVWDMFDRLARRRRRPASATLFIQSRVPEHAELTCCCRCSTPLGWLERVPTYKDQIEKLRAQKDLSTYGFLGYPLMQAADILIYRANKVPVGEDQVPHIEITREIARRFNHLFGAREGLRGEGRGGGQEDGPEEGQALPRAACANSSEQGEEDALEQGRAVLVDDVRACRSATSERLFGYLEGGAPRDPRRARGAAHRDAQAAGPGRPEDVQELRQRDHAARGPEGP